jgi:hypothetical protein
MLEMELRVLLLILFKNTYTLIFKATICVSLQARVSHSQNSFHDGQKRERSGLSDLEPV